MRQASGGSLEGSHTAGLTFSCPPSTNHPSAVIIPLRDGALHAVPCGLALAHGVPSQPLASLRPPEEPPPFVPPTDDTIIKLFRANAKPKKKKRKIGAGEVRKGHGGLAVAAVAFTLSARLRLGCSKKALEVLLPAGVVEASQWRQNGATLRNELHAGNADRALALPISCLRLRPTWVLAARIPIVALERTVDSTPSRSIIIITRNHHFRRLLSTTEQRPRRLQGVQKPLPHPTRESHGPPFRNGCLGLLCKR